MGFNLDDYEPVENRLARFWDDHPAGRVTTELVPAPEGQWIVRSEVWRDGETERPDATGYAHEIVTQRGVNSTSALENCETSSIGRALANLGYATKGSRPSREEMVKAARPPAPDGPPQELVNDVIAAAGALGIHGKEAIASDYQRTHDGRSLSVAGEPELTEYRDALKARAEAAA